MEKRKWWDRHRNHMFIGITAITFVMAVIGSCQYYGQPQYVGEVQYDRLWSTILYSVLKLYTFSPTVNIGAETPWCYEIAKWMAPLCTAYWTFRALETVLRHKMELLFRKLGKRKQIAVFGYNEESHIFLRNLAEESEKNCREKQEVYSIALVTDQTLEQELQLQLERKHILVFQENLLNDRAAETSGIFIKKCLDNFSEIILFYEDAALNFAILKNFVEYTERQKEAGKAAERKRPVRCAVRCEKRILKKVITDYYDNLKDKTFFELTIFSMPEMAAADLFKRAPLYKNCLNWTKSQAEEKTMTAKEIMEILPNPHLLIAGFGRYGQAIFEEAVMAGTLSYCSHAKGYEKLKITIIDENSGNCRKMIESRYPRIGKVCDIEYIDEDIESIEVERQLRRLMPVTYVAICFSDQTAGVGAMEKLMRCLAAPGRKSWTSDKAAGPIPIGVRMKSSGAVIGYWMEKKKDGRAWVIQDFGTDKKILTYDNVMRNKMETDAMNFNAAYVKIQNSLEGKKGGQEEKTKEELWSNLNFEKKESNRAQVKNGPYIRELIASLPPLPDRDEVIYENIDAETVMKELDEYPILDALAAQEHKRWCNFHYGIGYAGHHFDKKKKGQICLVEEDGEEYYGKVHYCLIDDWDEMKADEEAAKTIIYDICSVYGYMEQEQAE